MLPALIESHAPLDLVIIMLGTNDLKASLQQSAYSISLGAKEVCDTYVSRFFKVLFKGCTSIKNRFF